MKGIRKGTREKLKWDEIVKKIVWREQQKEVQRRKNV